jgi:hypothetical protein
MLVMVPIVAVMGVCLFALLYWLHRDRTPRPATGDDDRPAASLRQHGAVDYERAGLNAYLRVFGRVFVSYSLFASLRACSGGSVSDHSPTGISPRRTSCFK